MGEGVKKWLQPSITEIIIEYNQECITYYREKHEHKHNTSCYTTGNIMNTSMARIDTLSQCK